MLTETASMLEYGRINCYRIESDPIGSNGTMNGDARTQVFPTNSHRRDPIIILLVRQAKAPVQGQLTNPGH